MRRGPLRIAIVVGEVSGDALGASLVQALQKRIPNVKVIVEGIVGKQLLETGAKELFPMEKINLMGLFQPILHLPELFRIRKQLVQHFMDHPPDVFIGIDAPDFNLGLECILRKKGIKTVHYVSPTVWAWRSGRLKTIKKAVDLMLTIFPFETKIYEAANIPVCFVGHPFADEIPLENDKDAAKKALGFSIEDKVIAILPGSRNKELEYLAEPYLRTAAWCFEKWHEENKRKSFDENININLNLNINDRKDLKFIMPVISEKHKMFIEALIDKLTLEKVIPKNFPLKIMVDNARLAMEACDTALVTSGTATMEVMLHKKPMVVGYKLNPITYQIAKYLVKLPYIAMANIIAEEALAPEFIQDKVDPEEMGKALLNFLSDQYSDKDNKVTKRYRKLHENMRRNSSETAAEAILVLVNLKH